MVKTKKREEQITGLGKLLFEGMDVKWPDGSTKDVLASVQGIPQYSPVDCKYFSDTHSAIQIR